MARFVNPDNSAFQISLNSEIYVDKTELIRYTNSVIGSKDAFIYNSRPRRFGKSYTANMLTAYYSKGSDSLQMFSNLKIGTDSQFKKHLNQYDVIMIDIQWFASACKERSKICSFISRAVIEELKTVYSDILYDNKCSLFDSLSKIYNKTGNRFVFIIDECDAIIRDPAFTESEKSEYFHFFE